MRVRRMTGTMVNVLGSRAKTKIMRFERVWRAYKQKTGGTNMKHMMDLGGWRDVIDELGLDETMDAEMLNG